MNEERKKLAGSHPVLQIIGYLDRRSPFPIGSIFLAALSVVYLLNPTAGVIELIPDNIPLIGNLDEAAAAFLLIWSIGNMIRWWRVRQAQRRALSEAEKEGS